MAKHRGHGEGSIYQRQDKRCVGSISLEGGKRKYFYGDTRRGVADKLKVALREQQQGTLATGPQQSLNTYLTNWLEEVHKPTLRVSSYVNYRKLINTYILPALGHIRLQKLSPQQVLTLYRQKEKEGLSPKTINSIHGVLHKALDNAVRWNLVSRNVCDLVSPPRIVKPEIQPLTMEQAHKLLEAARGHRLEAMLTVALTTGMRRGELLALRWADIDFEHGHLRVRRTMNYLAGHGFIEGEPKTQKSRRSILLPQFVIEALEQHKTHQGETRQKAGARWHDHDLVFCNMVGGFQDTRYLGKLFTQLLKDAGLPHMRFHDLRHSAATILLGMNVHTTGVQELRGHSNISTTMDTYSHFLPSMQKDAMDGLDDLFGGDKGDIK